jgi:prepilin-type N-terminal cleavage/methylation domain-containing protein
MIIASDNHPPLAATPRVARLQPRPPRRSRPRGFTLLELGVCVIIMGILVAFIAPSFRRVTEQNRVDAAAQYLRSVWAAQRVYWLENRTFADSFAELDSLGLIDPKIVLGSDGYFGYAIGSVTDTTFSVTATRSGSSAWSGTLIITQDGEVTGNVNNGSAVLTPPDI